MPTAKITKRFVDSIQYAQKGQIIYSDSELAGFGLVVGRQSKSYFAQKEVKGKTVRVTIGKHGVFTPEQARMDAKELLVRMARGENPNETKREKALAEMTLQQACDAYEQGRKDLSEASIYKLNSCKEKWFDDWLSWPLSSIKKDLVFKRHAKLGEEHGGTTANKAMRTLRAIYNFAMLTNDTLPPNPVRALSLSKAWFEDKIRRSLITPSQLKPWYDAVMLVENSTIKDYLCLLLFTGMRKNEGLSLRWENIDFNEKVLTVPDTKNGRPLTIPMSDYVHNLLKARKLRTGKSPWVFPSKSTDRHLIEPKKTVANVIEKSGVTFMLHDLRRTFITIAESLDISSYAVKQLVNHSQRGDVTAGYIVMNAERLREPAQKIAAYILQKIEDTPEEEKKTVN